MQAQGQAADWRDLAAPALLATVSPGRGVVGENPGQRRLPADLWAGAYLALAPELCTPTPLLRPAQASSGRPQGQLPPSASQWGPRARRQDPPWEVWGAPRA